MGNEDAAGAGNSVLMSLVSRATTLANDLFAAGSYPEAAEGYRNILRYLPTNPNALHMLGIIAYQSGNLEQAAELIGQAILNAPPTAHLYGNLGDVFSDLNRLDAAIDAYTRAIACDPHHVKVYGKLGLSLKMQGKPAEALAVFKKALDLAPDSVDMLINAGDLQHDLGKPAEAVAAAEAADRSFAGQASFPHKALGMLALKCGLVELARKQFELSLQRDPDDLEGVFPLLAGIGFEKLPTQVPEIFLKRLYGMRASGWDQAVGRAYRGTGIIMEMVDHFCASGDKLDIRDAGCGTGLIGREVQGRAKRLDGVDLSQPMLDQARAKQIYTELCESDLISFMADRERNYDLVTCAATLIHFVDLQPAFASAATTLRDHGMFIFTLFPNEQPGNSGIEDVVPARNEGLARGGCFAHSRDYVARTAAATDFSVAEIKLDIHEYNAGVAQECLVVALRRCARA